MLYQECKVKLSDCKEISIEISVSVWSYYTYVKVVRNRNLSRVEESTKWTYEKNEFHEGWLKFIALQYYYLNKGFKFISSDMKKE